MAELRIANWNVEWRKPRSRDAEEIRGRLSAYNPDVVCLTETWAGMLGDWGGHVITSRIRPDKDANQRSVLLWSRHPWATPDDVGHPGLPRRCFIAGTTLTPLGAVRVAGIIIPYHMADVVHGTRDQRVWEQHESFLDHLPAALSGMGGSAIVLGDFNQRIPASRVPAQLQAKLRNALAEYSLVTAGKIPGAPDRAIDHIALGCALTGTSGPVLSNLREDGRQLSDHFGVTAIVRGN